MDKLDLEHIASMGLSLIFLRLLPSLYGFHNFLLLGIGGYLLICSESVW